MKPIKFAIALFVFATAIYSQAAPLLNGVALEQQFNKDRFIAAVYSDTLTDNAGILLDNSTGRRLEVRIVAGSLSARRFRNQWMEGIAINNPGDTLRRRADDMVAFANLLKGRFQTGDRLTVDFSAVTGTSSVALNGTVLGEIENRDFFNTLLRAWIGPVPPSSDFRDSLLAAGDVPPSLRGAFEQLKPSSARIAEVAGQLEEREEEKEAAAQTVAAATPAVTVVIPPPTLASASSAPKAPAKTAIPSQPKPSSPRPASSSSLPPQEVIEEDEEEETLTADLILARQLYHAQLLRHTFRNIRYPRRAQERGQVGSVRLHVTIDTQGHVKDVQIVQESRHTSLNREARNAVNRASPYPAAPPQLMQDDYEFSLPITFRLPN